METPSVSLSSAPQVNVWVWKGDKRGKEGDEMIPDVLRVCVVFMWHAWWFFFELELCCYPCFTRLQVETIHNQLSLI